MKKIKFNILKLIVFISIFFLSNINSFAQIPTNNLVLHYTFDGDASDQTNNAFDGTVNGANLSSNRFGGADSAYHFNGINSHVTLPYNSLLQPNFPFSISLWVNPDTLPSGTASTMLFASDQEYQKYSGFWVNYNSQGRITAAYGDGQNRGGNNRKNKDSNFVLDTTSWHSVIAIFYDLNDIELYIDCINIPGIYTGTGTSMYSYGNAGAIGKSTGGYVNSHFRGKLDDIRLYNDSLSIEDIEALCNEYYGCDIDSSVTISGDTLISNTPNATYRWFNCIRGYNLLPDDTLQSYLPPSNGSYAVEVTIGNCVDTSACIEIRGLGIEEERIFDELTIYPNPSQGLLNIKLPQSENFTIILNDMLGRKVYSNEVINESYHQIDLKEFKGIYILQIRINDNTRSYKIMNY